MPLIQSISGIRGTIGGAQGTGLTPPDIMRYTAAFAKWIIDNKNPKRVVVGRDARPSGKLVTQIVVSTLQSIGIDVINLELATTPTVAMSVPHLKAGGGIVITASHNPANWNALKLLNQHGEFVTPEDIQTISTQADCKNFYFSHIDELGTQILYKNALQYHIEQIISLPLVDTIAIREHKFHIAIDGVASVGGIAIPQLLKALGVSKIKKLYCTPNGRFPHNPEPVSEHLEKLSKTVQTHKCDLGVAVDPDVDRLMIIDEHGNAWGEEYTLISAADYVLQHTPGPVVNNLSSSSVLAEIAEKYKCHYESTPVGERHVVTQMHACNAIIGGEGNGGVIYPPLHYGRDALVGIALLLSYLARERITASKLRNRYPNRVMIKDRVQFKNSDTLQHAIQNIEEHYRSDYTIDTRDGIKVTDKHGPTWVHLRVSNTEPIVRIIAEASTKVLAQRSIDSLKLFL